MQRTTSLLRVTSGLLFAATAAAAGCGDNLAPMPPGAEDVGTVELSLISAPADAACLRVTAASTAPSRGSST